jgi:hypothetical protein
MAAVLQVDNLKMSLILLALTMGEC